MRIAKLTANQLQALSLLCEKWRRIALCTTPVDRRKAERAATELYTSVGVKPRQEVVWLNSLNEAQHIHGSHDPFRGLLFHFFSGFRQEAWRGAMRRCSAPVCHEVQNIIGRSMSYGWWSTGWLLQAAGLFHFSPYNPPVVYGQMDSPWLALADFFQNVVGVKYREDMNSLMRVVDSCGFFWPGEKKVSLFERPEVIKVDEQSRPHCVDGPAIAYKGGLIVYAIHGVPVPRKYIETEADKINVTRLLKEPNSAIRMAVLSKIGLGRFLDRRACKVVSESGENKLVEFRIGETRLRALILAWQDKIGAKKTILSVPCTAREFGRDRPDNINDCEQVRRWTLEWPKEATVVVET